MALWYEKRQPEREKCKEKIQREKQTESQRRRETKRKGILIIYTPEVRRIIIFTVIFVLIMVIISDGNSEIGAHERSNIFYLIWLRHLIISQAIITRVFSNYKSYPYIILNPFFLSSKRPIFFTRAQHVLSYHLI